MKVNCCIKNMHKKIFYLFLVFIMSSSVFSETVILNNEEVYRGKVKSQDANTLKMIDESGTEKVFSKNDILKVVYRDVKDKNELEKIIKEEKLKKGISTNDSSKKGFDLFKYFPFKYVPPKHWAQISARSAVIPGWGQYKAGEKSDMKWYNLRNGRWVGALALVGVAGAFVFSSSSALTFKGIEADYRSQTTILGSVAASALLNNPSSSAGIIGITFYLSNKQFEPYNRASTTANNAIIALSALYGIQLLHSYYIGKKWQEEQKSITTSSTSIGEHPVEMDWNISAFQKGNTSSLNYSRENYYESSLNFRF